MNEGEKIAEVLEMAANWIAQTWGQAYPEDAFPRLPLGEGGVSEEARSRISGAMARHIVRSIEGGLREWAKAARAGNSQ